MAITAASSTIGAEVSGVDLCAGISDELAARMRAALDERGVLVFVGQDAADDEAQKRIASIWAAPRPHPIVEFLGSDEVIGVVFNDADHPPAEGGDSKFHTDYSFNPEIPDVAVLRPLVIPPVGGATVWSDARAALASLDDDLVDELRGLVAHHDMGPRFGVEMEARFGAELAGRIEARFGAGYRHPIVAAHPRTGDELLFVNAGFTRYVVGLSRARSDALLARLFEAFADPASCYSRRAMSRCGTSIAPSTAVPTTSHPTLASCTVARQAAVVPWIYRASRSPEVLKDQARPRTRVLSGS